MYAAHLFTATVPLANGNSLWPLSPSSIISIMETAEKQPSLETGTSKDMSIETDNIESSSPLNEEPEYPTPIKRVIILLSLAVATFLVALDNTIIGTAIPKITDHFHALDDVGWYGSAYLFTLCALQLFWGKLFTLFSIKYGYLASILIFELGSAVCGSAPSSNALIVGRAIAGVGAAGNFSGGLVTIAHTVPLEQRPMVTGLLGALWAIACVAGPLLGGVFTDQVSWRWCFYINIPIGAVVAVALIFTFDPPKRPSQTNKSTMTLSQQILQLDPLGTLFFITGVVCCLLALQWGGSRYHWSNPRIIILLILSIILLLAFIFVQIHYPENATIPLRIIRKRSILASVWCSLCLGALMYILVYFLPIWFQAIKGASAWKSGVMLIPFLMGMILTSILAGITVTLTGYYVPPLIASSIVSSVGAGLLTTFHRTTNHSHWIGYLVLVGAGIGLGVQQPLICAQTVLPLYDIPIGTSLLTLVQSLGGCIFLAIVENVFLHHLITGLESSDDSASSSSSAAVLNSGATSLNLTTDVKTIYNRALVQAWNAAVAMAALSLLGSLAMEWRSVKKGSAIVTASAIDETGDSNSGSGSGRRSGNKEEKETETKSET